MPYAKDYLKNKLVWDVRGRFLPFSRRAVRNSLSLAFVRAVQVLEAQVCLIYAFCWWEVVKEWNLISSL